jgi:DNA-binding MarR family transcriptional regulator
VRRPDPDDGRARLVELSARGRAALEVARQFHRDYENRLLAAHGPDAIRTLRSLLEDMAGAAPDGLDRELRGLYL